MTDGRARQVEELQFALGEGPCVEASASGRPVLEAGLGGGQAGSAPFAEAATVVVLHLQDRDEALTQPIDNQAEVHQATG